MKSKQDIKLPSEKELDELIEKLCENIQDQHDLLDRQIEKFLEEKS